MLVIVLCILCIVCIGLLAALLYQTKRLRAVRQLLDEYYQSVDEFCKSTEEDARKREAAWHDLVHDLRNPVASVYALAELIQDNRDNAEQVDHFLDSIHTAAQNLLTVLQEQVPPRREPIGRPCRKLVNEKQ